MTPEEKKEVEARLDRANKIEEQIENIESALEVIEGGRFYLNACTFQKGTRSRFKGIVLD